MGLLRGGLTPRTSILVGVIQGGGPHHTATRGQAAATWARKARGPQHLGEVPRGASGGSAAPQLASGLGDRRFLLCKPLRVLKLAVGSTGSAGAQAASWDPRKRDRGHTLGPCHLSPHPPHTLLALYFHFSGPDPGARTRKQPQDPSLPLLCHIQLSSRSQAPPPEDASALPLTQATPAHGGPCLWSSPTLKANSLKPGSGVPLPCPCTKEV